MWLTPLSSLVVKADSPTSARFRIERRLAATSYFTRLLILVCTVVWVFAAIDPEDRTTWALEQIATVLVIVTLLAQTLVRYSAASMFALALLFCVHTIGTHYTYSLTPYDAWVSAASGVSLDQLLGWERNNYDRIVHFFWGLCMTQPMFEVLQQRLGCTPWAASNLSCHIVLSTSALYELLEWAAAVVFGDGGTAYLGTQGDVWDAQADIGIALAGWAILMFLWLIKNYLGDALNKKSCQEAKHR